MFKYYTWALTEKTLSYVPGGRRLYGEVGKLVKRNSRGTDSGSTFSSSLRLARTAKERLSPGSTAMEVGTGWFHHDAFFIYLACDDVTVHLFDIEDKARVNYVHNYVGSLLAHVDRIAGELDLDAARCRGKLEPLLRLETLPAIYEHCGFVPSIVPDPSSPWLPDGSVDFMVSNCVLNHIPPAVLENELRVLRRMLKPTGVMHHLLGHDDHWTFHDRSVNVFNYYRYSDRYYRAIFETKMEFQNRMVKGEWLELFDRVGLDVVDYFGFVTERSRRAIESITVDSRYARWPIEDLAIIHSYVLLAPRDGAGPG